MHEITYKQNQDLYGNNEVGLCDEPFECESCTDFLHKTKSLLMTEWYIDNLEEVSIYSIQLGAYIDKNRSNLLKTENLYEIMNQIHKGLEEKHKVEFHKKMFLFHSRLRTDWLGEIISVEFEVFFPPINEVSHLQLFEDLRQNIIFNYPYKQDSRIYDLDDFESPSLKVKLYDEKEYKQIFSNLRAIASEDSSCDIEEIIYLHTLGTYTFSYDKSTGFTCDFLEKNKENITKPKKYE